MGRGNVQLTVAPNPARTRPPSTGLMGRSSAGHTPATPAGEQAEPPSLPSSLPSSLWGAPSWGLGTSHHGHLLLPRLPHFTSPQAWHRVPRSHPHNPQGPSRGTPP